MMDDLQAGQHLDAEQMNAFAEGALSPQERTASLVHLASCALCRQVLFVAQQALATETPQPVVVRSSWRERLGGWFGPVPIAVAGLCAGLLLIAVLRVGRGPQPASPTVAKEIAPQPPFVAPEVPVVVQPTTPAAGAKQLTRPPRAEHAAPPLPPPPTAKQPPPPAPVMLSSAGSAAAIASDNLMRRVPMPSTPLAVQVPKSTREAPPPVAIVMNARRAPAPLSAPQPPSGGDVTPMANGRKYFVGQASGAGVGAPVVAGGLLTGTLAEVRGVVTDPSGAAIGGALVTLRRADGAGARSARADVAGKFTLSALPAGSYALEIAAPGFATVSRRIAVGARELAQVKTVLPVGAESATVSVMASSADLQTMDAATGATVDAEVQLKAMARDAAAPQAVAGLPSGLATRLSAAHGATVVSVDAGGALFVSQDLGRHWKRVKASWRGAVQKLVLVPGAAPVFQLTTDAGEVWSSVDGEHWRKS